MSETSKEARQPGADQSSPRAPAPSPAAWEISTVDGKKLGPVPFETIARGMREGWLRGDDLARKVRNRQQAPEPPWVPIRGGIGKAFGVGVWISPPRAFGRRHGPLGALVVAAAALIGLTTYTGLVRFALDPVRALILGIGIPVLVLLLFGPLLRMPVTLIIIPIVFFGGFPLLGALTGIPPRQLAAEFTNLLSVVTIVITLALGGVAGYGLGYAAGALVGSRRRDRYAVPTTRQRLPESLEGA